MRYALISFSQGGLQAAALEFRTLHVKECLEVVMERGDIHEPLSLPESTNKGMKDKSLKPTGASRKVSYIYHVLNMTTLSVSDSHMHVSSCSIVMNMIVYVHVHTICCTVSLI